MAVCLTAKHPLRDNLFLCNLAQLSHKLEECGKYKNTFCSHESFAEAGQNGEAVFTWFRGLDATRRDLVFLGPLGNKSKPRDVKFVIGQVSMMADEALKERGVDIFVLCENLPNDACKNASKRKPEWMVITFCSGEEAKQIADERASV